MTVLLNLIYFQMTMTSYCMHCSSGLLYYFSEAGIKVLLKLIIIIVNIWIVPMIDISGKCNRIYATVCIVGLLMCFLHFKMNLVMHK